MKVRYLTEKKHIFLQMFICWLAYTVATCARLNFNAINVDIMDSLNVTKGDIGSISSLFAICYGVGQLINGMLIGKIKSHHMLTVSLSASALISLLIPVVPFEAYKYLWAVNGFVQSMLWTNVIQTFANTMPTKAMPRAILVASTTTSCGTFLAYGLAAVCSALGSWQLLFIISGISLAAAAVIFILCTLRLLKVQETAPEIELNVDEETQDNKVFNFKWMKLFSCMIGFVFIIAAVCNYTKVLYSNWTATILADAFSIENKFAIIISLVVPIIGLCGCYFSNALFKKFNNPYACMFVLYVMVSVVIGSLFLFYDVNIVLTLVMLALIAFCTSGINNCCVSILPLTLRKYAKSGQVAGIINAFCYAGESISSALSGNVYDATQSWTNVFLIYFISALVVSIFSIVVAFYWKRRIAKKVED